MGKFPFSAERAATRTAIAARRHSVALLAADHVEQQQIAAELDVSEATISQDLKAIRKAWLAEGIAAHGERVGREAAALDADEARLRALFRRRLQVLEAADAGLAGALIYHIPEIEKKLRRQVRGLVAAVQDVRPLLRTYDRILAIMTRRARLFGLDPEPVPDAPQVHLYLDITADDLTAARARVGEWQTARLEEARVIDISGDEGDDALEV